jgi:Na+/proline symporter
MGKKAGKVSAHVLTVVYVLFIMNQFIAGSAILSVLSGWTYFASLWISALVVLIYLLLGGMRSVVQTDIFQYLTMMLLLSLF